MKIHSTRINSGGIGILCERCWQDLSLKDILPYYKKTFDRRVEETVTSQQKYFKWNEWENYIKKDKLGY